MKTLNKYIIEGLKIDSKTKVNNPNLIDIKKIKGPETPGKDYFGEEITIIGWPFKDKQDINYKKTKEYIRKNGYMIYNDLEEIEYPEYYDYFVYAGYEGYSEVNCYTYGEDGVVCAD